MARKLMPLAEFQAWCETEPRYPDTLKAQMAAALDLNTMLFERDFESTSVIIIPRMGIELDCYTTPDEPFVLRALETADAEFKAWRLNDHTGEWLLEPRWNVQIVRDPSGRAKGATEKGCRAFCFVRTYVADQLHPAPFTQTASAPELA